MKDGSQDYAIDLLCKTWDEWKGEEFINPIIVNKYYVARPDLIALACYGDDKYGDLICKFNGISNPFDLNEGMLLQIPPVTWAREGCENREFSSCDLLDDKKSIQPDDNNIKVMRDEPHSSSTPTVGDAPPYIIDRSIGLVIY